MKRNFCAYLAQKERPSNSSSNQTRLLSAEAGAGWAVPRACRLFSPLHPDTERSHCHSGISPQAPEHARAQPRAAPGAQPPSAPCWNPLGFRALRDPSLLTSKESWWQLYFEFDVSFGLSTPKDTQDILSQRPALSVPAAPHLWDRLNPRARREPQHPRRAPLTPNSPPGLPRAAPGFTALSADPRSPCWPHGRRGADRKRHV